MVKLGEQTLQDNSIDFKIDKFKTLFIAFFLCNKRSVLLVIIKT